MKNIKASESRYIYDSAKRGPVALEELRNIFQYRDLVYQLIRRDIVSRYKRSVLGIAWTMLQPLGMMVVLTIVFSQLFQNVRGYPVYVLTGLVFWTFFSQTTTAIMNHIVWGSDLFRRIYLPRTAFAISSIGTGLVNLGISLIPILVIMLFSKISWQWSLLFLPIPMVLLATFALGVGLLLSTFAVYFPDVTEMYQIVLLAWMYLTPIIYPEEIIPETIRFWLFNLNPIYHLLETFRPLITDGELPKVTTLIIAAIISIITLTAGWLIFSSKADEFAYRA